MQKLTLIASIVSIITFGMAFLPTSGNGRDVVTHGDQSPAIGTVGGDQNIYYQQPSAEQKRAADSLPQGFSIDDEGFVLDKSGKRICERKEIRDETVYDPNGYAIQSSHYETRCKLWDGSWKLQ